MTINRVEVERKLKRQEHRLKLEVDKVREAERSVKEIEEEIQRLTIDLTIELLFSKVLEEIRLLNLIYFCNNGVFPDE